MRTFLKGGMYSYKSDNGHRSGLEDKISAQIKGYEGKEVYEQMQLMYLIPASDHTYTPDFVLSNGIVIEAKGIFETADRQKHVLIKKQYPNLDIRFVFSNPMAHISKHSKTTYAHWCDKNGFKYAAKLIPDAWFKEPNKDISGLRPKKKKKGGK